MNFKELIKLCNDSISNKISKEELFDILDKENVAVKYIPFLKKQEIAEQCAMKIELIDLSISGTKDFVAQKEIIKFFDGLMNYLNIELSSDDKYFDNYDILIMADILEYIKTRSEKDCQRLLDLIEKMCDITDVIFIRNSIKSFDSQKSLDSAIMLRDMLSDKDTINAISNILDFNDPTFKSVRKSVKPKKG